MFSDPHLRAPATMKCPLPRYLLFDFSWGDKETLFVSDGDGDNRAASLREEFIGVTGRGVVALRQLYRSSRDDRQEAVAWSSGPNLRATPPLCSPALTLLWNPGEGFCVPLHFLVMSLFCLHSPSLRAWFNQRKMSHNRAEPFLSWCPQKWLHLDNESLQ